MRARLTGLAACLVLLVLLVGLPSALIAVAGNPLPDSLPSWDQLATAVTRPDDGTLALAAIVWIGWVAWAVLTVCIITELLALLRGLRAPRLPALHGPQLATRALIATAALLFAAGPVVTHATATTTVATATSAPGSSQAAPPTGTAPVSRAPTDGMRMASTTATPVTSGEAGTTGTYLTHVTAPGDTLWALAERYLGDGHRYPQIAAANPELVGDPDFLRPGWRLSIPQPDGAPQGQGTRTYTVQPGDTLSQIAAHHLGDATRYPEIAVASRYTVQPDGGRLADPDHIRPGWTLTLPGESPASPGEDSVRDLTSSSAPAPDPPGQAGDGAPSLVTMDAPASLARAAAAVTTGAAGLTPDAVVTEPGTAGPPDETAPDDSTQDTVDDGTDRVGLAEADTGTPAWLLAGLTGAGLILAGGAGLQLRRHCAAASRSRRPGHSVGPTAPALAPVEKTLRHQDAGSTVAALDAALRNLARSCAAAGSPVPAVGAVQLSRDQVTLHLTEPAQLPAPWVVVGDPVHWRADLHRAALDDVGVDQAAPYPLLCTVGEDDDGSVWLLNLEVFGVVALTGDATFVADFARYLAAEVACNPWARDVTLHCVGVAVVASRMNPGRVVVHDDIDKAAGLLLTQAIAQRDRATRTGTTTTAGRATGAGEDLWPARLLLVNTRTSENLRRLLDVVGGNADQSGTAIVIDAGTEQPEGDDDALQIELTAAGRVRVPEVGLDLIAAGLTVDEAHGIATLLEQSTNSEQRPVPVDPDAPVGTWRAFADEAGALRDDYTLPRHSSSALNGHDASDVTTTCVSTSLLPAPDGQYLTAAATTREDLAELAPEVPHGVADQLSQADPTLDADLAAWFDPDCPLPRLALLGPVKARTRGRAVAVAKSKAYYTELLAYLATRRAGATTAEVVDAFTISPGTVRKHIHQLREWLGTNPRTGQPHLPDAREAPAAQNRGVGVYQVVDLLVDADLLRRLRVRGQAKGADGLDDLRDALRLITGQPFQLDSLRSKGWSWLLEGDRLDHHLTIAVVDVAHLVATGCLAANDLGPARAAAEIAALAAPDEEIPQLDLVAVTAAEGDSTRAVQMLHDRLARADEETEAPTDPTDRTHEIATKRSWPDSHAS